MSSENNKEIKLAHLERDESGEIIATQSLIDHLMNTAKYAAEIGKDIDCYYLSFLLGVSHDKGKVKENFQKRILGLHNKRVNHSSAGAIYLRHKIESMKFWGEIEKRGLREAGLRREILFYVITAHHGLYDTIGQGQNNPGNFVSRIKDRMESEEDKIALEKEIIPFVENELEPAINKELGISFDELILRALEELNNIAMKIEVLISDDKGAYVKNRERKVYEGFLARLLLSILKTADCFDSAQWSEQNKITPLTKNDLFDIFTAYHRATENRAANYAENADSNLLNKVRTQLSDLAQEHALEQSFGISQFEMPTGAGKTEAGLRYGVNNINNFKKGRLIYTAPFLSVVEQSAQSIKDVVASENIKNISGEEFVLEHHSNVINDEDENYSNERDEIEDETEIDQELYLPQSYITDYWDAAIIVTTMVQFYNTLFAGKAANICRFCKLIDSTIVLDEIQSLPVEHIYCFNLMLNFLSYIMKANILLCSATQPPFDHKRLDYPIKFSKEKQVIPSNENLGENAIDYSVFERSQVFPAWAPEQNSEYMELTDVLELLSEQMKWANSALCILNTRAAVKALFEKTQDYFPGAKVIYLTTNLCAAHRLDSIQKMRQDLKAIRTESSTKHPQKLICITTSLIEAGVDIDFDIVLRSVTGADSIEQARGRCNREGLLKEGGKVFMLPLKEDNTNVKGLKDIYDRGLITTAFVKEQVQEDNKPLDMNQLTNDFYQKYFLENTKNMIGKIPSLKSSALELLSTNDSKVKAAESYANQNKFQSKHRLFQSFRTASQEMKLIEQETKSLIVPYKNEKLIENLIDAIDQFDFAEVKRLLKKLQRYTVNIPKWQQPDAQCSFIYKKSNLFDLGIYILQEEYYDAICGVQIDETINEALFY
ncbi:MAG: CRISPR-associated helicase Cas3' [Saccharofermentanales bacterium]